MTSSERRDQEWRSLSPESVLFAESCLATLVLQYGGLRAAAVALQSPSTPDCVSSSRLLEEFVASHDAKVKTKAMALLRAIQNPASSCITQERFLQFFGRVQKGMFDKAVTSEGKDHEDIFECDPISQERPFGARPSSAADLDFRPTPPTSMRPSSSSPLWPSPSCVPSEEMRSPAGWLPPLSPVPTLASQRTAEIANCSPSRPSPRGAQSPLSSYASSPAASGLTPRPPHSKSSSLSCSISIPSPKAMRALRRHPSARLLIDGGDDNSWTGESLLSVGHITNFLSSSLPAPSNIPSTATLCGALPTPSSQGPARCAATSSASPASSPMARRSRALTTGASPIKPLRPLQLTSSAARDAVDMDSSSTTLNFEDTGPLVIGKAGRGHCSPSESRGDSAACATDLTSNSVHSYQSSVNDGDRITLGGSLAHLSVKSSTTAATIQALIAGAAADAPLDSHEGADSLSSDDEYEALLLKGPPCNALQLHHEVEINTPFREWDDKDSFHELQGDDQAETETPFFFEMGAEGDDLSDESGDEEFHEANEIDWNIRTPLPVQDSPHEFQGADFEVPEIALPRATSDVSNTLVQQVSTKLQRLQLQVADSGAPCDDLAPKYRASAQASGLLGPLGVIADCSDYSNSDSSPDSLILQAQKVPCETVPDSENIDIPHHTPSPPPHDVKISRPSPRFVRNAAASVSTGH